MTESEKFAGKKVMTDAIEAERYTNNQLIIDAIEYHNFMSHPADLKGAYRTECLVKTCERLLESGDYVSVKELREKIEKLGRLVETTEESIGYQFAIDDVLALLSQLPPKEEREQ